MQEHYVSLNPIHASGTQYQADKIRVYNQRLEESTGGPAAKQVGVLFGLTASLYMFQRQQRFGF